MTKRTLIFTHIPKCGGSSIRESVRAEIGDELLAPYSKESRDAMNRQPLVSIQGKKALFVHAPFPVSDHFVDLCDYFTILRDPVERIISFLNYHRWNKSAQFRRQIENKTDRAALTFLMDPKAGIANEMCKYLGRPNDSIAAFKVATRHYDHIGHVEDISATFEYLKKRGMSDGNDVRANFTKEPVDISLSDRAFIRAHVMEDIKLHDMLVS